MIERLQYISQQTDSPTHIQAIQQALDAGCKWIQLRIKDQSEDVILKEAQTAKQLCDTYNAKLVINDYPSIAKEVHAYGVHLGLDDMRVADARAIVGDEMIIGGTANTLADVLQRIEEGVDYIGLGPFRFTTTKNNLSPVLGVEGYKNVLNVLQAEGVNIPVIAIGGIDVADIPVIMSAGVYGIAMSGTITNAADKKLLVETILNNINQQVPA
jgi:thiamine-phosphate pyrophosphorylase